MTSRKLTLDLKLKEMKNAGLRITDSRRAILEALIRNHGPFMAEEIHSIVTKKVCDLVTVYRCLASFEKVNLIQRCDFGDGVTRYELLDAHSHHHHHVICRGCKKIEVLDDCELPEIEKIAKKRGYSGVTHKLEFFGLCDKCQGVI